MRTRARGLVVMPDGTLAAGTCFRVDGDYVTLVLDDQWGRQRSIDDGGTQVYIRADRVRWST